MKKVCTAAASCKQFQFQVTVLLEPECDITLVAQAQAVDECTVSFRW